MRRSTSDSPKGSRLVTDARADEIALQELTRLLRPMGECSGLEIDEADVQSSAAALLRLLRLVDQLDAVEHGLPATRIAMGS